jgi:hypothetical protein
MTTHQWDGPRARMAHQDDPWVDDPRTVLVNVTYQIEVPVVEPGDERPRCKALDVTQREAEQVVRQAIASYEWGGYSMLGKAFTERHLSGWLAVDVKVAYKQLPTEQEKLATQRRQRGAAGNGFSA